MASIDLSKEKKVVIDLIKDSYPIQAAMIEKNWKRYSTVIQYLVNHVPDLKNKTILDYGCGFPVIVKILQLLGYKVIGFEPYAGSDEKNIAKVYELTNYYLTDLENKRAFDVVLMIDVIEHLSIIKPIMSDVNSRTAQNGYLLVSTPNVMRWEMWLSFILRKTGHPQNIQTFLNAEDNYKNHQREFTMQELRFTLRHFGFKIIHAAIKDTQPERQLLDKYHHLLGKHQVQQSLKSRMKDRLSKGLKNLFPLELHNNLLVIGQKI